MRSIAPALAISVLAVIGLTGPPSPVSAGQATMAPMFHVPLLNPGAQAGSSGTVGLDTFKGKPVILLFWAPW